ncbi:MAG: hypothetical protein HDT06_00465 [Bacteroidales bacterium]|nr:hypothetical protein [Bacteroidales bacterium]MBD5215021.1 hypothetical protein [Bacteroidales bacterium]MBD5219856.1 hypothetical protein [Bacteroidales bacterium]MDE6437939.1 hypothetical protein [Muribaculaceae bacterium]
MLKRQYGLKRCKIREKAMRGQIFLQFLTV